MWTMRLLLAVVAVMVGVLSCGAADARHRPDRSLFIVAQADPKASEQAGRTNETYDQVRTRVETERNQARGREGDNTNAQVPADPCYVNPKLPQCDLDK